jgi:glycosyltransferase involved in cell wall biosynthesis
VIEKNPKVSVCVVTYNQEKYIRQCLQSIVDQETDFDFEVIVGDDCSTDGTCAVVREFADKYPAVIKTIFQDKNTGGTKNYLDVHGAAIGEYIAHMDGDDYALQGKLQKEGDFLDNHTECTVVSHPVIRIDQEGKEIGRDVKMGARPYQVFDLKHLVRTGNCIAHSSTMYRASATITRQSETNTLLDFYFHIEHASTGNIGFINHYLGCHRDKVGISSTGNRLVLASLADAAFKRAEDFGVEKSAVVRGRMLYRGLVTGNMIKEYDSSIDKLTRISLYEWWSSPMKFKIVVLVRYMIGTKILLRLYGGFSTVMNAVNKCNRT